MASLPEYAALVRDLQDTDIDPKSQDAQEIGSILIALDKLCEGQQTRSDSVEAAAARRTIALCRGQRRMRRDG